MLSANHDIDFADAWCVDEKLSQVHRHAVRVIFAKGEHDAILTEDGGAISDRDWRWFL